MRQGIKERRFAVIAVMAVFLLTSLLINNAVAFYDTFQYHPSDDPTDVWNVTSGGSCAYQEFTIEEYSNHVKYGKMRLGDVYPETNNPGWIAIKTISDENIGYIAFLIRYLVWGSISSAGKFNVSLYNKNDELIVSVPLKSYVDSYHNNDSYELIYEGNKIYLKINGEDKRSVADCEDTIYGVEFYLYGYTYHNNPDIPHDTLLYIDDISFDSLGSVALSHDGTMHTLTELGGNEITCWWYAKTIPQSSYDASEYRMKVKKFTTGAVINSTIVKDAGNSTTKPRGYIIYNRTELFEENYGLYLFYLTKNGEVQAQDYLFFKPLTDDSIYFDKETDAVGETATITYTIDNPDFNAYDYYVRIYDSSGNRLKSVFLTESSGSVEWNLGETTEGGLYYTTLEMIGDSSYELAYDIASVAEEVRVQGTTYNAKSESILGAVNVSLLQNEVYHNTTSNVTTGEYNVTDLTVDATIHINASKTNYTHNNFPFTPLQNGLYTINLFLLPDENHINITPPAIVGLVQSYPFYQNVSEATVNLWNTSIGLTTSNTTNSMGYFEFTLDNTSMQTSDIVNETFNSSEYDTWVSLANSGIAPYTEKVTNTTDENPYYRGTDYEMDYVAGKIKVLSTGNMSNNTDYYIDYEKYETTSYSINATKFKYEQMNQPQPFTVNGTEIKYIYLLMNPIYNLTVRTRSADTHATIMEFDTILNDGDVVQTTTGYINFSVNYGIHKVEVSADGYYPSISYVYVAEDTEKIMYLTPIEEGVQGGPGVYYAPHSVMFHVQDIFGNPISGVNVTAVGVQTTMGKWDWLRTVLGFTNESAGEIQNTTMNGTTDTAGEITFLMVETIKYQINFNKTSQNINETIYIYPKDERYTIVLGLVKSPTAYENIKINFSTSEVNSTHRFFNVSYQDLTNHTNHLGFYIYVKSLNSTGNVTKLYNETLTGVNTYNFSYLASGWKGKVFYVKCNATYNDSYFEPVEQTKGYMYYLKKRLIDLGFDEAHEWYYNAIAVALLVLIAAMFSGITVKYGAVITPGTALGLWWIGWLSVPHATIILPTAFVIGVLYYMSESAKEEGMT